MHIPCMYILISVFDELPSNNTAMVRFVRLWISSSSRSCRRHRSICTVLFGLVFTCGLLLRQALPPGVFWMEVRDDELEPEPSPIGTLNFPEKKPIKPYHGHDFLKDPPFWFDKRFKNPCWYEDTKLRCLPYFYIYGFRKSATTSLYRNIMQHPDSVRWGAKESQFFGYGQMYEQAEGADQIEKYVDVFDEAAGLIDKAFKEAPDKKVRNNLILGDASLDYMYVNYDWTKFPGNENRTEPKVLTNDILHHFVPDAKYIIVIRDPIERLYSEYYFIHGFLFKQNNTNPYSFHKCVEYIVSLYNDCFQHNTVRGCVYNNTLQHGLEPSMLLNLGIYYVYMEDAFRVFGRKNVLVLHVEDVTDIHQMRKVFDFLDMSELPDSKIDSIISKENLNTRRAEFLNSGPMLPETRALLADFYKPFNERLATLMNDTYYLFEQPNLDGVL